MSTDNDWASVGLDDGTIARLYTVAREYAAKRIHELHRDDAIQNGICRVLYVVANPPENLPTEPEERFKYLSRCLYNEIGLMAPQDIPGPTPRLPGIPTL